MSVDGENDLFATTYFCCFHGYFGYIYLTFHYGSRGNKKGRIDFHLIFVFSITSFDYQEEQTIAISPKYIF